jgi:hypothetical protein
MRCVVVAIVVAALAPSSAWAAKPVRKKADTWVALVHTTGDVPAGWANTLRSAAESVTDQRTWLPPPELSLDEIQLTLGCAAWGPACAGQATALIGATNALVIEVARDQHGVVVQIDGVSGTGAVVGDGERVEVAASDDGLAIASAWVVGAVRGARPTVLVVTADLDGTEVVLDNAPVGVTPLTLVNRVSPGVHTLLVRRDSRAPLSRSIVVQPGTVNRVHAPLAAGPAMKSTPTVGEAAPAPLPTLPSPSSGASASPFAIAGYGLGGVGALAAVGGLVGAAVSFGRQGDLVEVVNGTEALRTGLCISSDGNFGRDTTLFVSCTTPLADGASTDGNTRNAYRGRIGDYVNELRANGNAALVIAGAGALVAATGIALVVATMPGETADAAAAP